MAPSSGKAVLGRGVAEAPRPAFSRPSGPKGKQAVRGLAGSFPESTARSRTGFTSQAVWYTRTTMWFSKTRALQDLVATLRAENSDLRAQVRFLTQTAHDRETKLIDRILAVTHPAVHREIHPLPPRPIAPPPGNGEQQRVWQPGVGMTPPPAPRPVVAGTATPPPEPEEKAEPEDAA